MSAKLIQFPKRGKHNAATKFTELESKMNQYIKLMTMQSTHLKEQYDLLRAMEKEHGNTNDKYNALLLEYAERLGTEKVPLKYMNHGSNVKAVIKEGKITLEIE